MLPSLLIWRPGFTPVVFNVKTLVASAKECRLCCDVRALQCGPIGVSAGNVMDRLQKIFAASSRQRVPVLAAVAISCICACVQAQTTSAPVAQPTAMHVAQALAKGRNFLYKQQQPEGRWPSQFRQHAGGTEALAILAILSSGEKPQAHQVKIALEHLRNQEPRTVYSRALRIMVYARLNQEEYGKRLRDDVAFLVSIQTPGGGWGYGPGHPSTELMPDHADNSNTQLALLALDQAAQAGAQIPPATWRKCRAYWVSMQNKDGGWGYTGGVNGGFRAESYGSMTASGVASMQILLARIAPMDEPAPVPGKPRPPAQTEDLHRLRAGLAWLEANPQLDRNPLWAIDGESWARYYLYSLGRAANSGGLVTIGERVWPVSLARTLLAAQQADGSWSSATGPDKAGPDILQTSLAMLALSQCQTGVVINKLSLGEGDHLDAWNLCRYLEPKLRQTLTWQSLTPQTLAGCIDQAPILYITGRGNTPFSQELAGPIRNFIEEGGTVLVQPLGGDSQFAQAAQDFFAGLLPRMPASQLQPTHPVFNAVMEVNQPVQAICIGDAARTRVFILQSDLAGLWHQNRSTEYPGAFALVFNLLRYTMNGEPVAMRLKPPPPVAQVGRVLRKVHIARVKHKGDWDVHGRAMDRLNESLAAALNIGLEPLTSVNLSKAVPEEIDMLWLTGTTGPELSEQELANLRDYLHAGGSLFVDPAIGDEQFAQAATAMLESLLGKDQLRKLPAVHSIISGDFLSGIGSDLQKVEFLPALAAEAGDDRLPLLFGAEIQGRMAVIFSRYGVTCPMEAAVFGCRGLSSLDARRLACNVVLYTISQKQDR